MFTVILSCSHMDIPGSPLVELSIEGIHRLGRSYFLGQTLQPIYDKERWVLTYTDNANDGIMVRNSCVKEGSTFFSFEGATHKPQTEKNIVQKVCSSLIACSSYMVTIQYYNGLLY